MQRGLPEYYSRVQQHNNCNVHMIIDPRFMCSHKTVSTHTLMDPQLILLSYNVTNTESSIHAVNKNKLPMPVISKQKCPNPKIPGCYKCK